MTGAAEGSHITWLCFIVSTVVEEEGWGRADEIAAW